jgi:hypothetical protein
MAIIAVLIGLLVPAVQKIRGAANQLQCQNNMRNIVIAMEHMSIQHKKLPPLLGPYPAGTLGNNNSGNPANSNGPPWGNPFFFLLPFIEQDNQWKASYANLTGEGDNPNFLTQPGYTPWSASVGGNPSNYLGGGDSLHYGVKVYVCPGDPSAPNDGLGSLQLGTVIDSNDALCSYAANALVFGKYITAPGPNQGKATALVSGLSSDLQGKTRIPQDITDGTSNTIMFTERYANAGYYNDLTTNSAGNGGAAWAWWGAYTSGTAVLPSGLQMDTAVPAFNYFLRSGVDTPPFQSAPLQWQVNVLNQYPSSPHTGVIVVGMCDGSVRTVSEGISNGTWWAACTPSSGDRLDSDW